MREVFEVDPYNEGNQFWVTVERGNGRGRVSVLIKADDDGVVVDLWPAGNEMEPSEASTWLEYPRPVENQYE
jgi:hypothetical protein